MFDELEVIVQFISLLHILQLYEFNTPYIDVSVFIELLYQSIVFAQYIFVLCVKKEL